MWKLVHNGYTPNELESYENNEKWYALFGVVVMLAIYGGILVVAAYYGWDIKGNAPTWVSDFLVVWMIGWLLALLIVYIPISGASVFRRKICRGLAGIELGVLHCSDDLVITLDIPREYADMVIDGQYDNWLKAELTCKYLG